MARSAASNEDEIAPPITSSVDEAIIFDSIKGEVSTLPSAAMVPLIQFYNCEQYFTASYQKMGNEKISKRGTEYVKDCIEETYEAAQKCIQVGGSSIGSLSGYLLRSRIWGAAFYLIHLAVVLALVWTIYHRFGENDFGTSPNAPVQLPLKQN
jgi:hypothetical protein